MRTTFLVRDGLCQVVLHPETRHERAVLDLLQGDQSVEVHRAQFSEAQAGYVRDYSRYRTSPLDDAAHLPDTVLVMRPVEPAAETRPLPSGDFDQCRLTDGTWVSRTSTGQWLEVPLPYGPDRTYEVRQLEGEMAAILDVYARAGLSGEEKLEAIARLAETALGRGTK